MKCPFKPLYDNVILKRDQLKTGKVILPDVYKKRNAPNRGVVVAVGPGADESVNVGHVYLFGAHGGAWLNAEGKAVTDEDGEYYVLKDVDLIAEVEDVRASN